MTAARLRLVLAIGATLIFLLAWAFPIFWSVLTSFKSERDVLAYPPKLFFTPTLEAYRDVLFGSGSVLPNLWSSLVISVFTTAITMAVAIPAAYALARLRMPGRRSAGFYVLATQMLPPVGIIVPYFLVLRNIGWIDTYQGIILIYLSFSLPFAIWLLVSYFEDIPLEMEEAAYLDGASRLKTLWRIIIPQVRGGIAVTVVFVFLNAWNEFLFAVVLSGNTVRPVTIAIFNYISVEQTLWAKLAAASVLAMLPVIVLGVLAQKHIVKGLTVGAVKGGRPPVSARGQVRFDTVVKLHGAVRALKGIDLEIRPGEFFALLGPSGSGKSTTLRILAGLDVPTSGRVFVDGADVTFADARERDVAMVFQSYALYPHMTVGENIAFPLEMAKTPKGERAILVREAAAKVKIDHLLDRKPGQLSGGQQQRCALARAIVRKARLFLLDEPLSNLDAKLRMETRVELKKLQRSLGVTAVYVTHDQEEAMTLADRMAVFMEGEIRQVGRPAEVFARPNSVDVAAFIGSPPMNLIEARYASGAVEIAGVKLPAPLSTAGERDVIVGIRPGALQLGSTGIPARVDLVEDLGDLAVIDLDVGGKTLRARTGGRTPEEGDTVFVHANAEDIHLFDPATGARL